MRYASPETLERRLEEWQLELRTNQFGMAHLAQRAIAVLREELKRFEPQSSPITLGKP
jgi:hypothetical protein